MPNWDFETWLLLQQCGHSVLYRTDCEQTEVLLDRTVERNSMIGNTEILLLNSWRDLAQQFCSSTEKFRYSNCKLHSLTFTLKAAGRTCQKLQLAPILCSNLYLMDSYCTLSSVLPLKCFMQANHSSWTVRRQNANYGTTKFNTKCQFSQCRVLEGNGRVLILKDA